MWKLWKSPISIVWGGQCLMGSWQVAENTSEERRCVEQNLTSCTELKVCCYVFLCKEKGFFLNSPGRNRYSLVPEAWMSLFVPEAWMPHLQVWFVHAEIYCRDVVGWPARRPPSCLLTEQGKKIGWKILWVEIKTGRSLTSYHHRQNRLNLWKSYWT